MGENEVLTLFDIDGTLVKGAKCHYHAFIQAVREVYGINGDMKGTKYAGMTDQQILRRVLEMNELDEVTIKEGFADCLDTMIRYYLENVHREKIRVLEGVRELLMELQSQKVLLGLVTGNLEPIAHAKLNKVNLDGFFQFGGFGSDNHKRPLLVKMALNIAQEDFNYKGERNFVIGDTPRDIAAGQDAGVKTIAVATGNYSKDKLEEYKPDLVLESLKDKNELLKIIYDI